ncbi:MAG TPA: hypothetical protein VE754_01625 [Actinomycetota bacterium]|jgi:hypothetical protein|nr:hypothetical protein [Actinomycetota bacterium]
MRRYLVVANQTLGGRHLIEAVRERIATGPSEFHVVVPATPPGHFATWTEGEALAVAEKRLHQALTAFKDLGAEATGEVGDPNPFDAVCDALLDDAFDEVILSTLPVGASRWLKQDLPHRVERRYDIPVTHIVADAEPG